MKNFEKTQEESIHPKLTETLKIRLETRLEQLNLVDTRISKSLKELTGFDAVPTSNVDPNPISSAMQDAGVLGEIYNLIEKIGDVVHKLDNSANILETII